MLLHEFYWKKEVLQASERVLVMSEWGQRHNRQIKAKKN
jgi:hypothetical protein